MINDVYKDNFGESINDVAEAMATVNQNMSYLDDSALQKCTEYAYTLSDTFGVDGVSIALSLGIIVGASCLKMVHQSISSPYG